MIRIILAFVIPLIFISCKPYAGSEIQSKNAQNDVEVIKFMGTVRSYSVDIYDKTFWLYPDEHARLTIQNGKGLVEEIKSLKDHRGEFFKNYNYAFLSKNGRSIDTLYSDYSLKTWVLKKNKKATYFYDEKGEIAKNLRSSYSFFKECW